MKIKSAISNLMSFFASLRKLRAAARQGIFARNCQLANAGSRLAGKLKIANGMGARGFFFARAREFQEQDSSSVRSITATEQLSKKRDLRSQDSMPANGTRVKYKKISSN